VKPQAAAAEDVALGFHTTTTVSFVAPVEGAEMATTSAMLSDSRSPTATAKTLPFVSRFGMVVPKLAVASVRRAPLAENTATAVFVATRISCAVVPRTSPTTGALALKDSPLKPFT
jgi:hypothetical protein